VSAREKILGRVRAALEGREPELHPGSFEGWRPEAPGQDLAGAFATLFEAAGGDFIPCGSEEEAAGRVADFAQGFSSVSIGRTVPESLHTDIPETAPRSAALAVSMARGAVAETGSLLLDARDGRRTQLLAPTHLVCLRECDLYGTLAEALAACRDDLPSALGLHSGPSKSADIGQILVTGVHGPGRVVVVLIAEDG
jgi:L-lactate dehydrogenase complex protein LldG